MKKRNLIKLVSACMSCLLLTTPLCSAVNTIKPNSKKENTKNTVLKVGGTIAGLVGLAALAGVLYNKFSSDTIKRNFLSFEGIHRTDYYHISEQEIALLKKHVMVVQKSVVDKNFLRQIGSNGDTVVVNAANSKGENGGGVCGTIFEEMGIGSTVPEVVKWMKKTGASEIGTGNVFIHLSYNLRTKMVKYVMQTVGPDFREYSDKKEAYKKLYEAYYNTIILAALNGAKNVVMPAISMGIFKGEGYICHLIALTAIADALNTLERWGIQIQDFWVYLCDFLSGDEAKIFFDGCRNKLL